VSGSPASRNFAAEVLRFMSGQVRRCMLRSHRHKNVLGKKGYIVQALHFT
jgi:hypothetical protein